MADDKYKGINDYAKYEALSKSPIQMAMKITELEGAFKHYRIHNDPNRRAALIERLRSAVELSATDTEEGHLQADDILLEFIDDEEVTELYGQCKRYFND
jgi:hypothetical protein